MPFQNPFQSFRQRNLLAGAFQPGIPQTSRPRMTMDFRIGQNDQQRPNPMDEIPRPDTRYEDDLLTLQNQMGPGLQAYKEYLNQMPAREAYKPNWLTRIAAGLAGGAAGARDPGEGIATAQELNSSRYRNALQDYANRGVGLKAQAGMEQDELESKIRALQNARAMGLKYDEFQLKNLQAQNDMQNKTTTANAAKTRAEAYAAAQSRPGYDTFPQEDGSVLYVSKTNPEDRKVVPAKTVAAGQLGVARENARTGRINAGTNITNAKTAQGNLEVNQQRARDYGRSVDIQGQRTEKPALPRVQQDAEDNALRQMMTDPLFKDFIGVDKDGYPTVGDDDGSEDYQDFLTALDAKTQEILRGSTRRARGGR